MFVNIWNTILYEPLLNILAFLVNIIPKGDLGLAVVILTILVKILLSPLSKKTIENQAKMSLLAPEMEKIKKSNKSKEEQARLTFDLYKKHKTNPFSGCLLILIQIPIIFALYYVFYKGIKFDEGLLYSFVPIPKNINMYFLGLLDISQKSVILAILAGISQYFQAHFMPRPIKNSFSNVNSFQENFTRSMHIQMKYVFPVLVTIIAYSVSGAVALYWITSNIFSIGQQIHTNKKKITLNSTNNKNDK